MNFLTLKPEAFGLDISDLSLKLVKLKKTKNGFDLVSFGEEKIKPGIIKEGEIKDQKALSEIIKRAIINVKGKKLKTKYVVASLPEERAFLQVIQMPKMSEEDLKSAVVFEAENYIPLPIEKVYLDSQVVQPDYNHPDHCDVLIAALPKTTIDPYVSVLKLAGLNPIALEIESLAIARALTKNELSHSPVLLIDLGQTRTSFIVFSGRALRFTSSIPVSAGSFTEIISRVLKVDFEVAEKLKIKYGLEEKIEIKLKAQKSEIKRERGAVGEEDKSSSSPTEPCDSGAKMKKKEELSSPFAAARIFEALVPPLVDLIQQIKKHLDYYQTHASHEHLRLNGGREISKILLCGGGANLKGLAELLSLELKTPVELGNPWVNILPESLKEAPGLPFEKSLSFATALGLALRGVKSQ